MRRDHQLLTVRGWEDEMLSANAVRLLIADDDPNVLAAHALFFDAHGYETRIAEDGADALAEWRAWRPDVVVLDIQMPHMDGRAVAREIRRLQSAPFPLLVAVTALASTSEQAESIRSGFDHHFVKPADLPAVLAVIAARVRPGATDDS
ncbi:response regulator receiver domain-containing protein [Paraburkholderia hospita]|jgi:CheY-like chemotaxis protein|uniref:Response regulator receiver domain-containing protein n=2 Tax=Paraburkholderia hospita TaxID=169430 RepID=A0ABP2PA06_9BURK|nr:response regulator receiver domain-containing protein [Paraburkholderia hospita]OUL67829.1 response regulator [Paraburkholderia hospita]OUL96609.1 response regulator [Paraburkholderia hospita]